MELVSGDGTVAIPAKVASWAVMLLPYLEQGPLYDAWQDNGTTAGWTTTNPVFYPDIRIFQCSSDSMSAETQAKNSFVCNAGFYPTAAVSGWAPGYNGTATAASTYSQRPQNGVFNNRLPSAIVSPLTGGSATGVYGAGAAATKQDTIKDGLTQTIAFSENLQADQWGYVNISDDSVRARTGMVWLYALNSGSAGSGRPSAPQPSITNRINGNKDTATVGDYNAARPSSGHSSIVNVAFLGGSVSSISNGIDYHVYQALLTPQSKASDMPNNLYLLKDVDYMQ
ncbi:MAG: DUF1559 domain-containing protein [Pirellulales bacterium]